MSMLGGIGASAAASEILALVEKLKRDHQNPEVLDVLSQIEHKAQEIKEAGDSGY